MLEIRVSVIGEHEVNYQAMNGVALSPRHMQPVPRGHVRVHARVIDGDSSREFEADCIVSPTQSDFDYGWATIERMLKDEFKIQANPNAASQQEIDGLRERIEQLEEENEALADELADAQSE